MTYVVSKNSFEHAKILLHYATYIKLTVVGPPENFIIDVDP